MIPSIESLSAAAELGTAGRTPASEQQEPHEMSRETHEQQQIRRQAKLQLTTSRQEKSNSDFKQRIEDISRQSSSDAKTIRHPSPTDFFRKLDLPEHLLQSNDNDGGGDAALDQVPSSISIPGEDVQSLSSRGSRSSKSGSSKGGSSRSSSHRKKSKRRYKENKNEEEAEMSSEEMTSSSSVLGRNAHRKTKSQLLMDRIREEALKESPESLVPLSDLASMLLVPNQPGCKSA